MVTVKINFSNNVGSASESRGLITLKRGKTCWDKVFLFFYPQLLLQHSFTPDLCSAPDFTFRWWVCLSCWIYYEWRSGETSSPERTVSPQFAGSQQISNRQWLTGTFNSFTLSTRVGFSYNTNIQHSMGEDRVQPGPFTSPAHIYIYMYIQKQLIANVCDQPDLNLKSQFS